MRRTQSAGSHEMSEKPRTFLPILLLAVLPSWAVVLLLRLNTPLYIGDDAYMTFKVARSLLESEGFVYNAGEYVLVTTTPLWTLLLAVISHLGNSDPTLVFRPLGLLLDLLNCILLLWLASLGGKYLWRGALSALLFALSWHMNFSSIVGMEPNLFVFLMLVALLLQMQNRWRGLSGAVAAFAFMTRPEGALLLLAIGVCRLLKDRRIPWPEVLGGSLVALSYMAWLYYYFGSVLPHAGVAKSLAYYRTPFQALNSLVDHLLMFTLTPAFDAPNQIRIPLALLVYSLWLLGVLVGVRSSIAIGILGLFTFGVQVLYSVMNPHIFEWYMVPLEVSYAVSLVWGLYVALRWVTKSLPEAVFHQTLAVLTTVFLLLGFARYELPRLSLSLQAESGGYRNWPSLVRPDALPSAFLLPVLSPQNRELIYIDLAKALNAEAQSDDRVLAPEYGAFGYYSKARMLSSIGHTSKEMFQYLPVPEEQLTPSINNAISREMVAAFEPEYILSLDAFIRKSLLNWPEFANQYEVWKRVPTNVFGSQALYLFKRKEVVAGSRSHSVEADIPVSSLEE